MTAAALAIALCLVSWTRDSAMVKMRDSCALNTNFYLPDDTTRLPLPVILLRTPYGADNAVNNVQLDRFVEQRGYVVVTQDCRGRYESGGVDSVFLDDGWRDPKQDGYDCVDWIVRQPWCDGRVGTAGGSAVAITQVLLAGASHPAHVCANPVVAGFDLYKNVTFPGGEYRQYDIDWWLTRQNALHMREFYADHYCKDTAWQWFDGSTRQDTVRAAMLHYGGWYDIFSEGTVEAYQCHRDKGNQRLLMGPWSHLVNFPLVGEILYPFGVFDSFQAFADRWYDFWLKDSGSIDHIPQVSYYLMGPVDTTGFWNDWYEADDWPPGDDSVVMWLRADSGLSFERPTQTVPPDTFVYDPRDPVPSNGGNNLALAAGPRNQQDQLYRADVLRYVSEPLPEDLVVEGRIRVRLYASSDRLDTDFTAKLVDCYNDVAQRKMLVLDNILMARHRNGLEREDLLAPGNIYEFDIELGNTAYVFPAGHRVLLAISSSNSPRFLTNLNNGGHPWRDRSDTLVATNVVFHDNSFPSRIIFQGRGPTAVAEEPAPREPGPRNGAPGFRVFDVLGRRVRACRDRAGIANLGPGCYVVFEDGTARKVVRVR